MSLPESLSNNNPAPPGPDGGRGSYLPWTSATKDGVGTARSFGSTVWYTLQGGTITEIYYPDVDTPQVRDLQFIVTDGHSFFHDPRVNYTSQVKIIDDPATLGFQLVNKSTNPNYTISHEIISEADAPVVLIRTRLEGDAAPLANLKVFVLLAPRLRGDGNTGTSAYVAQTRHGRMLLAQRGNVWVGLGADRPLVYASCGFVGVNDGWQDIIAHQRLPLWNFDAAENGQVALTGQLDFQGRTECVLALAFADGDAQAPQGVETAVAEALSSPFEALPPAFSHLAKFRKDWNTKTDSRTDTQADTLFRPTPGATFDGGRLFHFSRNVLLAHEDKKYNGALIASLSIPWGEANTRDDEGGYHLVWPRDMSQSATALVAAGESDVPLRSLIFLDAVQHANGRWSQNFYITGQPHWPGLQLDEYSFPILLAYRLQVAAALGNFDPRPLVLGAAGAIINGGPATPQERWEENGGYSPSTLAANIAALVCAAFFAAQDPVDAAVARFLLEYADFLESHVETWTVTTQGHLLAGVPRHYIRICPTGSENPDAAPPIWLGNQEKGTPPVPANGLVDAGFLELVRYGIRAPGDPLVEDSLRVIDATIRHQLPQGQAWRRYNNDGYGQRDDGTSYRDDGTGTGTWGVGRPWPLLAGERAHYEFAAGRDVSAYVRTLEAFAGGRGLLPEQVWNGAASPSGNPSLVSGSPVGSAMPLAWAHAEYIKLVRSISDGQVFDRIDLVAQRYLAAHAPSPLEIWNPSRQISQIPRGKTLRVQNSVPFSLHWSSDGWATVHDTVATLVPKVNVYYVDLPTNATTRGPLVFTSYFSNEGQWEPGSPHPVQVI